MNNNPSYTDRLKGTAHEGDTMQRVMCGVMDWLNEINVQRIPSERAWSVMLGISRDAVRKLKVQMQDDGVVEWNDGTGRKSHTPAKPKNGNTMADRKEWFKQKMREELYQKRKYDAMSDDEKKIYLSKIESFFDYYASEDPHNPGKLVYEKYKTFAFKSRFTKFIDMSEPKVETPVPPSTKEKNTVTFKSQNELDTFVADMTRKYGDNAWTEWKKNNDYKILN